MGYEREDVVAGQKVLVFSGKDGPTIFLAADLNGMMLKTVEGDDVVEAVVVEYKRFEIESVPDWPVSYRSYEKKIEAVKTVDKNLADQLKKALPPK